MGSDDLFKKRRAEKKKRKYEYKKSKANSFLIVTEGERTEPLYFKGLQKLIKNKIGGVVQVAEAPIIDICGKGSSTGRLIEITEQIVKNAKIMYQNVWVVFDKDDFEDFDQAIKTGTEKGYKIAWSNQSFEYWLYLHFSYSDSALHRDVLNEKLDNIFKRLKIGNGKYQKNYEDIYDMVNSSEGANDYYGVDIAIANAKRRMSGFDDIKDMPSKFEPGTTVYKLVEELKAYLDEK